jgi:PadR family transcriptional regulator PadR
MPFREKPKMMILKGLIQILIAFLLFYKGDMYGYEIKKQLDILLNKEIKRNIVYITLKKMEKTGLVNSYDVNGTKYYKLSREGNEFLDFHIPILKKYIEILEKIVDDYNQKSKRNENQNTKQLTESK